MKELRQGFVEWANKRHPGEGVLLQFLYDVETFKQMVGYGQWSGPGFGLGSGLGLGLGPGYRCWVRRVGYGVEDFQTGGRWLGRQRMGVGSGGYGVRWLRVRAPGVWGYGQG